MRVVARADEIENGLEDVRHHRAAHLSVAVQREKGCGSVSG